MMLFLQNGSLQNGSLRLWHSCLVEESGNLTFLATTAIILSVQSSFLTPFPVPPLTQVTSLHSSTSSQSTICILYIFYMVYIFQLKSLRTLGWYVRAQGEAHCTLRSLCAGEGTRASHHPQMIVYSFTSTTVYKFTFLTFDFTHPGLPNS